MKKNTSKNREETSQKIIKAVGVLISTQGFTNVGVNAVARQAGVDKVLIYRYFDGISGLYKAYAESADFWPSISELLGDAESIKELKSQPFEEVVTLIFKRYIKAIRSRPQTLEILAWETVERNTLTVELEKVREKLGLELMAQLVMLNAPKIDWLTIINMFTGAIHYLLIRSRKINTFTGMDISGDEPWEKIISSIEQIMTSLCHSNNE